MKPALIATVALAFVINFAPRSQSPKGPAQKTQPASNQHPSALTAVPPLTPANPQNRPQSDNQSRQNNSPNGDETAQWVLIFITGVTALFICWQAWETRRAANAALVAVRDGRETSVKQLRAYVLVSSALLKFPAPNAPEIQVHFRNFGQTPALKVRGWIHTWIEKYPLNVTLPNAPPGFRKGMEDLGAGRVTIFTKSHPVHPCAVSQLGTPAGTIYVYGEISYEDVFGKTRHTKYRLMYGGTEGNHPLRDDKGKVTGYLLKADTEGNETT